MNRKYEEITAPDVGDFCYITDNTYPKEEVIVFFLFFYLIAIFLSHVGLSFIVVLSLILVSLWL